MMEGDNAMVDQSGYSQFQVLFKKKNMFAMFVTLIVKNPPCLSLNHSISSQWLVVDVDVPL